MANPTFSTIEFRYQWFDETGPITGAKLGTGTFDGRRLQIGQLLFNVDNIRSFRHEGSFFYFGLEVDEQQFSVNVEIYATDVIALANSIQASRTSAVATIERQILSESGTLESYRQEICPFCQSTIMLTGLPETEQAFCEFCTTLFTIQRDTSLEDERYFRICEGCGMYSRPRQFAVFYFYFLGFTFGFHHDTTISCSGCMRKSAWKMVFGNLFGLLGFPFALAQLYRSYSTKKLTGRFVGLDQANVLARRKKIEAALDRYEQILERVPENAGVKYNIAFGLLLKNELSHSQQMFEMSLDDCANYWPSVNGLVRVLELQGKTKESEAVRKLWRI